MSKRKKTPKRKFMAYVLHEDDEFGYKMKKIAKFLDVSQGTISNWIKEVKYEMIIKDLAKQLKSTRRFLRDMGYNTTYELPEHYIDVDFEELD